MRITHLTTDEVNRSVVRGWAVHFGVRAVTAGRRAAGQVVDLDHLPFDRRSWVSAVLAAGTGRPVLAHGHAVTDAEAAALRRRGVTVCRGLLRAKDFRRWLRAVTPRVPALVG